jgi:hypothetical protein
MTGTYSISGDKLEVNVTYTIMGDKDDFNKTYTFEQDGKTIKLNGQELTKK